VHNFAISNRHQNVSPLRRRRRTLSTGEARKDDGWKLDDLTKLYAYRRKVDFPPIVLLTLYFTSVVSNCSLQRYSSVDALFLTEGLGSGAGRRTAPHKQEYTCPVTLDAWSHPLSPLFRRECRGATRRSARVSLTAM
jgi:hypothetical protein